MVWNELKPAASDPVLEFPSAVTAQAVLVRQGIEKHSFWTDASGASAGIPRLSDGSFGPGAARAFFDVASNASMVLASTKPLAGRLYIASDRSQLLGFTSTATAVLGGKHLITYWESSQATIASNSRVLVQTGQVLLPSTFTLVTFPTPYTVAPTVQVTPLSSSTTYMGVAAAYSITTSNFSCSRLMVFGTASAMTVLWRSHGTVVL